MAEATASVQPLRLPPRPWTVFLAATTVATAIFMVLPRASPGQVLILLLLNAATIGALGLAVVRAAPGQRPPWAWLTVGQSLYLVAYVIWFAFPVLLNGHLPFPSVADIFFIASYLADAVGVVLIIRSRGGGGIAIWLDSLLITTSLGVLSWLFVIRPNLAESGISTIARLVAIAYPLLDILIVAIALRLLFSPGGKVATQIFLVFWMAAQLTSDTVFAIESLKGTFAIGGSEMVGWLLAFGFLGAVALHPGRADLAKSGVMEAGVRSQGRLFLVALAVLLVPSAQVITDLSESHYSLAVISALGGSMFVVVLIRIYALTVNVETHQRIQAELEGSRRRFVQVLETLPVAVAVGDRTGYTYWNEAAAKMFGGPPARDKARWAGSRAPVPPEMAILPRTLQGEAVQLRDVEVSGPRGVVSVELLSEPLRDESGTVIEGIVVFNDVSEEVLHRAETARAAADLAAKAGELERSNAELEQFAYVASHDLQEPLRMVASYVQLLERRYRGRLDADADEFIEYAVDGARRMQVLITDLLTYARLGSRGNPLQPVPAATVLERALHNLQNAIAEHSVTVHAEDLPVVTADGAQLVQVFQNLISNAIKFRRPEVPVRVEVSAAREGDSWHFQVVDNGIGIDPQYAERIFVIFQRLHTREEYSGTGIGLAVCKKIVERHGGQIWMESEPGKGSTFHFLLAPEGVAA